jgi:putative transposase
VTYWGGASNTRGKIERWHQTLKNRILLEHYYLPGDLDAQVGAFVEHYNHQNLQRLRRGTDHDFVHIDIARLLDRERDRASDG